MAIINKLGLEVRWEKKQPPRIYIVAVVSNFKRNKAFLLEALHLRNTVVVKRMRAKILAGYPFNLAVHN